MSDENQQIDPAILGDNPSGLDPANAIGGMSLKEKPRGIKKINKKGILVAAGLLGGAAIVATTTFNGTGSAVGTAAKDAVATQGRSRPTEMKRDTLWYASVPDKVATGEPDDHTGTGQPDYLGIGNKPAGTPAAVADAAGAAKPAAGQQAVPDLTGKAVNPLAAATAARTGAAPYRAGAAGSGAQMSMTPAEQAAANAQLQAEQQAAQQAAQAKQFKQQQLDAAMKSNLSAGGFGEKPGQAAPSAPPSLQAGGLGGLPANAAPVAFGQQREDDPNKQDRKDQFLKAQAQATDPDYSPSRKTAARSPFEVKAGSFIPAVMISGINSDLPGEIVAQVRENVMDSKTGNHVLIPYGSRLIGLYDAHVAYGQQRVLVAWNRIIFRDGSSFNLRGMPGADMGGYAGFSDEVDNHYSKIFGSSVLLSLISAGVQLSQPNNGGSNTNNQPSVSQTVGAALGQQIGQTSMNITQKNLNIQPTLVIRPGYRFNIPVTADMILAPVSQ